MLWFHRGIIFCLCIIIIFKSSFAVNKECSGIHCYNGGSLSFENDKCVCHCPPGATGLLCGEEMKPSMWPPGPYALPMVGEGCPEDNNRGWKSGRIRITTIYPMSVEDSYSGCKTEYHKYQTDETPNDETYAHIAGYFDTYELQIHLCYKLPQYSSNLDVHWPTGNYSIYGVNHECPPEFYATNVTVCIPRIQTLEQPEYEPVFTVESESNQSTLQFTMCTRSHEENVDEQSTWKVDYPFSFLKFPDKSCQDIDGYKSSQSTLSSTVPYTHRWLLSKEPFMFCFYKPNTYIYGVKSDYWTNTNDSTLRTIMEDFHGMMYVSLNLEHISCGDKPKGYPSSYCGAMQKLTIDAELSVGISGILFEFDSVLSQYLFRRKRTFIDIFTSYKRIYTTVSDAIMCTYNEYSWENSDTDLVVVLLCNREIQARYVTIYTPDDILTNTFITILSRTPINSSDSLESDVTSCYSDMGMSDNRIKDSQLEASSSLTSHEPHQARPHYSGWCADLQDIQPYLQIDLISVSMIEGIKLYRWIEIETNMYKNLYNYTLHEYGRHSFILEYAVSMEKFFRFNSEPWPIDLSHAIDEPRAYLFKTPFLARYLRVYPLLEDVKWTATCFKLEILGCKGPSMAAPVYFDLFNDNLLNVYTSELMVNNTFILSSSDLLYTEKDKHIYRWNILATTGSFLHLQFTDIFLRPSEKGHLFKNDDFCKDLLIMLMSDIQTRQVSSDLRLGFVVVFDYRHNGRFPTVPVQYPSIVLEFRTCTQSRIIYEHDRRFSVMISEKDTNRPCFQEELCMLVPTILESPSFLGQLLEQDTVYTWVFLQLIEPNCVLRILDFDVSCSSGTQFIISDSNELTQTIYCNKNRSYDVIPAYPESFTIQYYTERLSCSQVLFREGFRLSYEKAVRENNIDLQNLTSYQTDFKENQPIWHVFITYPEQRTDVLYLMPNNGEIRKVCSNRFNKCYTIYIGLPEIIVSDAMRLCRDRNSTLVNFKTKLEMEFVREIVLQRFRDMSFLYFSNFYTNPYLLIGLLRYAIGNKYRNYWSDGSIADFTAWDENEPNYEGRTRFCTYMKLTGKGGWKTHECTMLLGGNVVCEQLMTPETDVNSSIGLSLTHKVKVSENNSTLTIYKHLLFACNNGEWVSGLARCNGIGECLDNSDEKGCLKDGKCENDEFKCDNGRCIHISRVCDLVNDCNDYKDEDCIFRTCDAGDFTCDGGVCHDRVERCDTIKHCKDGTDEINCDHKCGDYTHPACGLSQICLPYIYICNGVIDCPDGSDEFNCESPMKTCDDFIGTTARNGFHSYDDKYIKCEFDVILNRTFQTMEFLNVDWSFQRENEYHIEPHEFIVFALQNGYNCLQKFTQESRRDKQIVNNLLNKTDIDWDELFINLTKLESIDDFSIARTDSFEVVFTENSLRLRYYDNFDIENNRITLGPLQCYKESPNKLTVPCGDGMRPVKEEMRCVYDVDAEFNVNGCSNLNHIENCTDFVCPEQYVKCPQSYCILPHKICDGFMDCPHGEDEEECWCEGDEKIVVIFVNILIEDEYIHRACKLAGELYSQRRTILVIRYRADIVNFLYGQEVYSNAGHCFYFDEFQYSLHLYTNVVDWDSWSFRTLQKFDSTFYNSKSSVLIWMTKSELNEREEAISNFIKKYIESFGGNVTVYNLRADPTIQNNVKEVPSAVTEIVVRNWEIVDQIGPLLFEDECKGVGKSSCIQGYRCLRSRVCIQIDQLCDGSKQCPHGDDEMHCDFLCPSSCSCGLLTMKCTETHSNMTELSLIINAFIRNLDLSGTDTFGNTFLRSFTGVRYYSYLLSLNISNCKISSLSHSYLHPLKNIRTLDLSYNRIQHLTAYLFSNLTHLSNLFLRGNSLLSYIEPGTFQGLKITSLDLTGCSIVSISMNTFSDLTLNYIDMSFNGMDIIDDFAFNRLSVKNLMLQGNRINVFSKRMFEGLNSVERLNTPAYKFCCIRPIYLKEESCLPYKDEFSSCADLMRNPILQALLWIIGSLALLGNTSSLVYRIYSKDKLKIGYGIFVTNLAVSDMLMGIYMLSIAVADSVFRGRYIEVDTYWRSSNWCRLAGVLSTMSSEASVFFIAFITIDRILVIKFPFGNVRLTARKAIVVSVVLWILVTVLSVLPLIHVEYFSENFYSKSAVCLALPLTRDRPPGWIYSISLFIAFNFFMFVLIALGQLMIYLEIRQQTQMSKRMNVTRRNDLKVARNLLLLVSTDFMCWFPIGVMGLMAMNGYIIPGDVYAWTAVLVLPINSALNPFLYTLSAVMNKKSFNPNTDEQKHENWNKAAANSFVRIYSYFSHGSRQEFRHHINLSNILNQRPLLREEALLVALNMAKGLAVLHDEDLVVKKLSGKTVGIRILSNVIRRVYFNHPPYILSSKKEKAEDIYQFGILIRECIHGVCGSDVNQ